MNFFEKMQKTAQNTAITNKTASTTISAALASNRLILDKYNNILKISVNTRNINKMRNPEADVGFKYEKKQDNLDKFGLKNIGVNTSKISEFSNKNKNYNMLNKMYNNMHMLGNAENFEKASKYFTSKNKMSSDIAKNTGDLLESQNIDKYKSYSKKNISKHDYSNLENNTKKVFDKTRIFKQTSTNTADIQDFNKIFPKTSAQDKMIANKSDKKQLTSSKNNALTGAVTSSAFKKRMQGDVFKLGENLGSRILVDKSKAGANKFGKKSSSFGGNLSSKLDEKNNQLKTKNNMLEIFRTPVIYENLDENKIYAGFKEQKKISENFGISRIKNNLGKLDKSDKKIGVNKSAELKQTSQNKYLNLDLVLKAGKTNINFAKNNKLSSISSISSISGIARYAMTANNNQAFNRIASSTRFDDQSNFLDAGKLSKNMPGIAEMKSQKPKREVVNRINVEGNSFYGGAEVDCEQIAEQIGRNLLREIESSGSGLFAQ